MKTEEDEAFDELARKQGSWGGGYQAKRQMAADKQEPYDQTALELCDVCGWKTLIPDDGCLNCERTQPAQEPVARVSGVYGGRFTYELINRAMVLPVGMALYATAHRPWVGLTQKEVQEIHDTYHKRMGPQEFASMLEAKLKERNS